MAEDRELRAMETTLDTLQALEPEERKRVVQWLAAKLGVGVPARGGSFEGGAVATDNAGGLGTIKQFLKLKRPGDDVARATTLAYFLTHGQRQPTYTTADLTRGRLEAALANLNMSRAVSHALRAGYLTTAARRGNYQITSTGEAIVDAMPDAEEMRKVRLQGTRRRRKSASATRGTLNGEGSAK